MTKRILVLFTVLVAVFMLALPAFADSPSYPFDPDGSSGQDHTIDQAPPEGWYYLSFIAYDVYADEIVAEVQSEPFFLTVSVNDISSGSYASSGIARWPSPTGSGSLFSFLIEIQGNHQAGFYDVIVTIDGDAPNDWDPQFTFVDFVLTSVSPAPIDPEPSVPGISPEEGGIKAMVESVVSAIFAVFTAIGGWFVEFLPTLTAIFWTGEALTFLGVLAILGLGVSVIFLLINVIRGFLNFGR